jgi:hypothetical protein
VKLAPGCGIPATADPIIDAFRDGASRITVAAMICILLLAI